MYRKFCILLNVSYDLRHYVDLHFVQKILCTHGLFSGWRYILGLANIILSTIGYTYVYLLKTEHTISKNLLNRPLLLLWCLINTIASVEANKNRIEQHVHPSTRNSTRRKYKRKQLLGALRKTWTMTCMHIKGRYWRCFRTTERFQRLQMQ